MKRNSLLQLLAAYHPTPEEASFKERMIAFVQTHPDCFERTLEKGHITGSGWLISRNGESVLLTLHAKLNVWAQFGGHCDGDSDVLATAFRETQEESGIQAIAPLSTQIFDLDIHPVPARGSEKAHLHYDVRFLFKVTSNESFVISHESKQLQWFGKNLKEWPTQSRSIVRMHEKWLSLEAASFGWIK